MENLFVQKHKKVKWFKAGNVEDIPEMERVCVKYKDQQIVIFNWASWRMVLHRKSLPA